MAGEIRGANDRRVAVISNFSSSGSWILVGAREISSNFLCNINATYDTSFLIVGSGFRTCLGPSKSQ